ncbi:MAG: NUDIX domain-containing protein [Candidatus Falkowbacteria bacterium]
MKPTFALICLYTDDNKILIQDRKSINKYNSEWGLFGGHLKDNETDLQAVIRETKEELDIKLNKKDLIYVGTVKTPGGEVYTSIFLSKLVTALKNINVLEGDGCKLVSEKECAKLKLTRGDTFRTKLIFSYLKLKN